MTDDAKPADAASRFLGLEGYWKQVANLGLAGVMCGLTIYLITVTLPNVQNKFHDELKSEREAHREDVEKSRKHGTESAKELAKAISEQSRMMDWHQTMIQTNQEQMIDYQKKTFFKK